MNSPYKFLQASILRANISTPIAPGDVLLG